jgi:AraC family transcriptional regulator
VAELAPQRFEQLGELHVAGLSKRYPRDKLALIPDQWNTLALQLQFITGRVDRHTYGLWYDVLKSGGEPMLYATGVRVGAFAPVHPSLSHFIVPPQHYAVFRHQGEIADLRRTVDDIFSQWLPGSGYEHVRRSGAPDFFERYTESAEGGKAGAVEIWAPVKK